MLDVSSDTFDQHGDLRLVVGEEKAVSLVCSRALARASPTFFNTLLYGNFAEAKGRQNGDWRIDLPEDDPHALCLLLNIIHGRFERVPDQLSEDHLYRVIVLTDKYGLAHILRPWVRSWLNLSPKNTDSAVHMAWIAWELGDHGLFSRACTYLLNHSHVGPAGDLTDANGFLLDSLDVTAHMDIDGTLRLADHATSSRDCLALLVKANLSARRST